MSNRVIHFEIPVDEPQRAVAFYEAAFGWRISKWDGPMDYWNVKTGEGPGINGALLRRGTVSASGTPPRRCARASAPTPS